MKKRGFALILCVLFLLVGVAGCAEGTEPIEDVATEMSGEDVSGETDVAGSEGQEGTEDSGDVTMEDGESEGTTAPDTEEPEKEIPFQLIMQKGEFRDSFTHQFQLPVGEPETVSIDFKKCYVGTFRYSRDLTQEELENSQFYGYITDTAGNMALLNTSFYFWEEPEMMYAVELPDGLVPGTYVIHLERWIKEEKFHDSMEIIIDEEVINGRLTLDFGEMEWKDGLYYKDGGTNEWFRGGEGKTLMGSIVFSRELIQEERENIGIGLGFFDATGERFSWEDSYGWGWPTTYGNALSGEVALLFPQGFPAGTYTITISGIYYGEAIFSSDDGYTFVYE